MSSVSSLERSPGAGDARIQRSRIVPGHIRSATTRRRSADWDEYNRIAEADKRVAMVLRPDRR